LPRPTKPKGSLYLSGFIRDLELIGSDLDKHLCPICKCTDRERHLLLFFEKYSFKNELEGKKILHFAPELSIYNYINSIKTDKYICGDKSISRYTFSKNIIELDLTAINFKSNEFDFIICNHVLEHIPDHKIALFELHRVLKKDGKAIIQFPFSNNLYNHFQDRLITTPQSKLKFYGQHDHEKVFGKSIFDEIATIGFEITKYENCKTWKVEETKQYGINPLEDIYIFVKK